MDAEKAAQRFRASLPLQETRIIKENGHIIYNAAEIILSFIEKVNYENNKTK